MALSSKDMAELKSHLRAVNDILARSGEPMELITGGKDDIDQAFTVLKGAQGGFGNFVRSCEKQWLEHGRLSEKQTSAILRAAAKQKNRKTA